MHANHSHQDHIKSSNKNGNKLQSNENLIFNFFPLLYEGHFFTQHGYDVFIANARGNRFSRNHTSLDPNDGHFWKFRCVSFLFAQNKNLLSFCHSEISFVDIE